MLRAILIRFLIVFIVVYCAYALHIYLTKRRNDGLREEKMRELESVEYDENEWEKIKKELEDK